jgi:hypothetical protein
MVFFVLGIALVLLVHFGMRAFVRANPTVLTVLAKGSGGLLSLVAAALLLIRGRVNLALTLGGLGVWLLGGRNAFHPFGGQPTEADNAATGGRSSVRSAMIEMELDHTTGAMDGTVTTGPQAGRRLGDLDYSACRALYGQCERCDPDGARLLEAYLDRRFPDWRAQTSGSPGSSSAAMTVEEAYQILGLPLGADREEIMRAHHGLMKKLHPDHGGSTYLAARVNAAKDLLLRAKA